MVELNRKKIARFLAPVLAASLVLTLPACTEGGASGDTSAVTETTPVAAPFTLTADLRIVYSGSAESSVKDACRQLAEAILAHCGVTVRMVADYDYAGEPAIIVGNATRCPSAVSFYEKLYERGYGCAILSETEIVIGGKTDENTYCAVRDFIETYIENNAAAAIEVSGEHLKNNDPPAGKHFTLNGVDLADFTVVAPDAASKLAATIASTLRDRFGVALPVQSEAEFGGGSAIYLALGDCASYGGYRYEITGTVEDGVCSIRLNAQTEILLEHAVELLLGEYLTSTVTGVLTVPEHRYGYHWKGLQNSGLVLRDSAAQTLAEGVTYYRLTYDNRDGDNVDAYAVVVAPGAKAEAAVWAAPAGKTMQVAAQAHALESASGKNVLAMSNAGFFRLNSGALTAYGAQIVEGEVRQEPNKSQAKYTNMWFGMTTDGEYVIADTDLYESIYKGKLWCAAGGGKLLMTDGVVTVPEDRDPDPVTGIATIKGGGFALLCVDGRSSKSAGANYADMTQIFMDLDLDIDDMMNFDGGGSTALVVENEKGRIELVNVPSDNPLRPVADTLAIVAKG